ncbi:MAG TPA: hypothetical protein VN688_31615, partial [Gemmataceae bacterium]|nr:hypothetical protein [Gemmataceae bacterium]
SRTFYEVPLGSRHLLAVRRAEPDCECRSARGTYHVSVFALLRMNFPNPRTSPKGQAPGPFTLILPLILAIV